MLIRHKAEHDPLTDLLNRGSFEKLLRIYEEGDSPFALIMVDVDYFKTVNDTCGHAAGDDTLKKIASLLTTTFRSSDYVCRIGGDEFLVLCLGIEEKDLREHVEKLRMDMKEHQVTMAVGMIWKEHGPKDIDLLLNESERLMYEDKDRYYKEHGLKRRR